MRVLCVGNMYPPHHHGGYELIWKSAVEHLRERGHQVRILTTDHRIDTSDPDDPDVYRELRWHLRDWEFADLGVREAFKLARHNHRLLDRHLGAFRPDVVAWWSMGGLTMTMLETVRRRRIPAKAFLLDEWIDYGRWVDPWSKLFTGRRRKRLARPVELAARIPTTVEFAEAAEYYFISEYTRSQAESLGLGLRHTAVAHSGINGAFLEPAPERDWQWQLLYLGRLDPRKGIDTAIEALPHIPHARLAVVGGGGSTSEEQRLRDLTRELGVADRVAFEGQRSLDGLVAAYEAADAVLFPVRWNEPWGLVPIEAMAKGRPVVATGRGGSGEYLRDGENCLLFEAEDPRALAAAVQRLADDVGLRARLRDGGLRTAPRYTETRFNQAVEAALQTGRASPSGPAVQVRCAR
jgi:glycosyltransferase involved in cell wall biosynthesis